MINEELIQRLCRYPLGSEVKLEIASDKLIVCDATGVCSFNGTIVVFGEVLDTLDKVIELNGG